MPLKPEQVIAAVNGGKSVKLSDGHSLYMVSAGKGIGSWVFQYRDGGKLTSKGLGSTHDLSPAAARRARDDFRVKVRRGEHTPSVRSGQPSESRRETAGPSLVQAALALLTNRASDWKDAGEHHKSALRNHCGAIADRTLRTVTREQVADVLRSGWRGPCAGGKARLRGFLEAVFAAADISPNPASWERLRHLLPNDTIETTHHEALPSSDIPELMAELDAWDGEGDPNTREVARCLRFCILTATRTIEAVEMDWSEVHLNGVISPAKIEYTGPVWLIPKERMKKGREHGVPLSAEALALLGAPQEWGRVFRVTNTKTGFVNPCSLLKVLKKFRPQAKTHGCRTSFGSWAETRPGHPIKAIDLCLSHQERDKTRRSYLRATLWDERRSLMAEWARFAFGNVRHLKVA